MDAQQYIREIGRRRDGARGLSYEAAVGMFEAMFGGGLADVELGAILIALRMKGESLDEIRAGLDVLGPRLRPVPVDHARPVVSIPSYGGARDTANLVPLLACLLAAAGVQVVVHGVTADPWRTTTAEIMQAMGLCPCEAPERAEIPLSRGDPAFVPAAVLSPRLGALLDLRRQLGVRNVGHTLAALLNPTSSLSCLRISGAGQSGPDVPRRAYFAFVGCPALVLNGAEGEAVASTRRAARIDWIHGGCVETLVPEPPEPVRDLPALPDPHDVPATARWIQSVLAGERPVPGQIDRQVGAVLAALQREPGTRAVAAA
jgi:anthranilate phosphoribosyltransferase